MPGPRNAPGGSKFGQGAGNMLNPNPVWPFWVRGPIPEQAPPGAVSNQVNLSATLAFTGSQNQAITKLLAAVLTFTGSLAKQTLKALTASLLLAGARTLSIGKALGATLAFSGAQSRAITKGMAAALGFTGKLTKALARTLTAAVLTFAGALTKQTSKPLAAVLSFTGAMARLPGKSFSAALSFTGAQSKAVGKGLAANLTFTGSLRKAVTKSFAATLTFTGSTTKLIPRAFTAVLGFTGALARLPGKSFSAGLSFTGKQSKVVGKNLPAALTFTGAQAKAVTQHLTAALTFTGRLAKSIGKKIAGALSFVGNLVPVHSGPSNAPPTICYPTTALIVPYASSPSLFANASSVTIPSYSTTTTIPGHDTATGIASYMSATGLVSTSPAYSAMVLSAGATSYYRLDDTTTTAVDQKGAVNGTYSGTYTQSQPGALINDTDTATTFTSGQVLLASNPLAVGSISVEAWFKSTSVGSNSLVDIRQASSGVQVVNLFYANGQIQFFVGNGTTSNHAATPLGTYKDGNWHHVVGTYDGATITIFMDGASVATAALAGPVSYGATPTTKIANDVSNRHFVGTLDEVAFYNSALSPATVGLHYSLGRTPSQTIPTASSLVGYASGVTHFNTCND